MKNVQTKKLNIIERQYEFKTEIRRKNEDQNAWELLIIDCQKNVFNIVEREIKNILVMKKVRTFSSDYLPGLQKCLESNRRHFEAELEIVQTKTKTAIQLINFTNQVVSNKLELYQASNFFKYFFNRKLLILLIL